MNKRVKSIGFVATIGLAGLIEGCAKGDSHVLGIDSPSFSGATITGQAVKGLLSGADCVALSSDLTTELYSSVGNASACTDANGAYSFQLPSNPTGPVVVEMRARSGTAMLCDFPDGCGSGVAFGQSLTLDSSFRLRAVVPQILSTATSQEVNISPWTEVAASRAIALAGTNTPISTTNVDTANLEVAGVLNNMLGLEGATNSFDANFFTLNLVDVTSPVNDSTVSAAENQLGTLMSMASASLFDLIDTSANTSIESIVTNLANAFDDDGEFNVNDTATNINSSDNGIDLADILTGIAEVALDLSNSTNTTIQTNLDSLLGTDLVLTTLQTQLTALSETKNSVTDQNNDPTAPVDPQLASASDLDKAKKIVIDLKNVLDATVAAFDLDETGSSTDTVFNDIGDVLAATDTDVVDRFDHLTDLIAGASFLILDQDDTMDLQNSGCTFTPDTSAPVSIQCSIAAISNLLDTPNAEFSTTGSGGSVTLTVATNTVTTGTDPVMVSGDKYELTLVRDASSTATTRTFNITTASVDIANDMSTDITLGSTSTVTGVENATTGQDLTFTVNADDISISITDSYSFTGELLVTRDLTQRDTLLTVFDFDGTFTLPSSHAAVDNSGAMADASLSFTTDTSSAQGVPAFEDETDSNFYTVNNIVFQTQTPVTYTKSRLDADGNRQTSTSNSLLLVQAEGDRTAVKNGNLDLLKFSLVDTAADADLLGDKQTLLTGTAVFANDILTYTLNNGLGAGLTLVDGDSFSGSISVGGVSAGSITESGTATITLSTPETAISLGALFL